MCKRKAKTNPADLRDSSPWSNLNQSKKDGHKARPFWIEDTA
jgi:hypothetical protein